MFKRIKQRMNEALGGATKTSYDTRFEVDMVNADHTKEHTSRIVDQIETMLQPDPAIRMNRLVPFGSSKLEDLGSALQVAAVKIGSNTDTSQQLMRAGNAYVAMGSIERKYIKKVEFYVIQPLIKLEDKFKDLAVQRKALDARRLDMDSTKHKVLKATKQDELLKLEAILKTTTEEFEKQAEVVKAVLDQYPEHHDEIRSKVKDMLRAECYYHQQCFEQLNNALLDMK